MKGSPLWFESCRLSGSSHSLEDLYLWITACLAACCWFIIEVLNSISVKFYSLLKKEMVKESFNASPFLSTFAFSSLAIARLIPCFILLSFCGLGAHSFSFCLESNLSFFIEYIPVAFLLGSTPAPFVSLMHQLGSGSLCGGTLLSYFWACWFLLVMEQAPLFWSGNLLRSLCMDCFVSWPASLSHCNRLAVEPLVIFDKA